LATPQFERIYVWELPVRAFHWTNAACIAVLGVTGYLIGAPLALRSGAEASASYWFGTVRFIHFATAYLLTFNFLVRLYWALRGNAYSNWKSYLAFSRRRWREVLEVLRVDILQLRRKPLESTGHNAMASLVYFAFFLAILAQVATGFGLYAAMSEGPIPNLFRWVVPLLGGDAAVRQLHHAMLWFFVLFTLVHVYLVAYHDHVEGRGIVSSMVGGWKFIEPKESHRSK
jgi:Ni/Fe-hydrogenase 1 B-type cytochrome subunit